MSKIKIEDSQPSEAIDIMQKDCLLLRSLNANNPAILHFHNWKNNAITHGYFIKINRYFTKDTIKNHKLDIAKRPSGGGIVFHNTSFSFAFFLHKSHPLYSKDRLKSYLIINNVIKKALSNICHLNYEIMQESPKALDFCVAQPTKYDILVNKKKLCGAAQRHSLDGVLHHATLALAFPPKKLLEEILNFPSLEAIYENSYLFPFNDKNKIKEQLIFQFRNTFSNMAPIDHMST